MSWVFGIFNTKQAPSFAALSNNPTYATPLAATDYQNESIRDGARQGARENVISMEDEEEIRSPYWQCMLAGGMGGTSGDMLMHSVDTVKTRQQGDPHIPSRYGSLPSAYLQIFRQEGFRRGLYSGVTPAFLGSFPGTIVFFGAYEYSKRYLIDRGWNHTLAYLSGGFIADFAACFVYVPSEVIKTRLQLQGRFNNPFFNSGYNYRSTWDAARTIVRQEGFLALYSGYKATIFRDLPFSALQFAFYEQERRLAKEWVGSNDIGLGLEIATAVSAGGLAGTITCPLDVVKTRVQTQVNTTETVSTNVQETIPKTAQHTPHMAGSTLSSRDARHALPSKSLPNSKASTTLTFPQPDATKLDTSSIFTGLRVIYRTEGVLGLFRGVGPRAVWTSVQSGTMLVLYQIILKHMAENPRFSDLGPGL